MRGRRSVCMTSCRNIGSTTPTMTGPESRTGDMWRRFVLTLAMLGPVFTLPAAGAAAAPPDNGPQEQVEGRTDPLTEELGRALGMTPAEIEGPGAVAGGDTEPDCRLHGGDGGRRLPRAAAQRRPSRRSRSTCWSGHRFSSARATGRPEGPAAHHHPVVQRQHPADQRRIDRGPPRHAPQPGPGSHTWC